MWNSMQPVIQDFIMTLVTSLLGVLSAFLIALAKKGFDWVGEKIESIKDERAQKVLDNALNNLYDIVNATVTSLQQTLGDDIKASISANDGKYTYEDLLGLKDKALNSVNAQLTVSTRAALESIYTDLNAFIADLIETKVRELKSQFLPEISEGKVLLG